MARIESRSIVLSSDKSDFIQYLYPPINLSHDATHELALINLDMYNSIPNIDNLSNLFVYDYNGEEFTITLPVGAYEIDSLNDYIQKQLMKNTHAELFDIRANHTTLRCIININMLNTKIKFNHDKSLKYLLGFERDILEDVGEHESENIVNIMPVNTILVNCDVIEGSYLNGSCKPIIYSFFPDVPPGYKINEKPNAVIYLPITLPTIESIRIWLTDQNNKPLNLRGETTTIRLHLKSTYTH
jgi:hypothetical protein